MIRLALAYTIFYVSNKAMALPIDSGTPGSSCVTDADCAAFAHQFCDEYGRCTRSLLRGARFRQARSHQLPCNGHGKKVDLAATCRCDYGFAGPNCEYSDELCGMHGSVVSPGPEGELFGCMCHPHFANRDDKSGPACKGTTVSVTGFPVLSCHDAIVWATINQNGPQGLAMLGLERAITLVANESGGMCGCAVKDFEYCSVCDLDHGGLGCSLSADAAVCATDEFGNLTGVAKVDSVTPLSSPRECTCFLNFTNHPGRHTRCECIIDSANPDGCSGCAAGYFLQNGTCIQLADPSQGSSTVLSLFDEDPALVISVAVAAGLFIIFLGLIVYHAFKDEVTLYSTIVFVRLFGMATFSVLDFVTDVVYVIYEPFADESYRNAALMALGAPILLLTVFFMAMGYRLISPSNLRWRFSRTRKVYTWLYAWISAKRKAETFTFTNQTVMNAAYEQNRHGPTRAKIVALNLALLLTVLITN